MRLRFISTLAAIACLSVPAPLNAIGFHGASTIASITPRTIQANTKVSVVVLGRHLKSVGGCTVQAVNAAPLVPSATEPSFEGCTARSNKAGNQLILVIESKLIPSAGDYLVLLTADKIRDKINSTHASDPEYATLDDTKLLAIGRIKVTGSTGPTAGGTTTKPAGGGDATSPYTDCLSDQTANGPVSSAPVSPTAVLCGSSIVPDAEVSDEFGYHVSSLYSVIQVRVSNKNAQYDFLLRDIVLTLPDGRIISGRIRRFAQGVAVKGKTHDRRSIFFNSLTATGGVYGALASFGSAGFTTAGNVLQGAFMSSFNQIFPDYTADNVNRFNNAVFDDQNPSIVPKDSIGQPPLYVMALVPKEPGLDRDSSYQNAKNIVVSIEGTFIKQVTLLSLSTTSLTFQPEFISPPLFASTQGVDFAALRNHPEDLQNFTLSNIGSTPMNIHSFTIVPSGKTQTGVSLDFEPDVSTSSCGIAGAITQASNGKTAFSLAPNATCVIAVRFHPTTAGPITATLNFDGDNLEGGKSVTLTGTGVGLILKATDTSTAKSVHLLSCAYSSKDPCMFEIGSQSGSTSKIDAYYFSDSTTDILNATPTAGTPAITPIKSNGAFPATDLSTTSSVPISVPVAPSGGSSTKVSFSNQPLFTPPFLINFTYETVPTSMDQTNLSSATPSIKVTVTSSGAPVTGKSVTFTITDANGKSTTQTPTLDASGTAGPNFTGFSAGNYTVTAKFGPADQFGESSTSAPARVVIPAAPAPAPAPAPVTPPPNE